MGKKRKVRWQDDQDYVRRDDVVECPTGATDGEIVEFLGKERGQGKLKPYVVGPAAPDSAPDIVIVKDPDGKYKISEYQADTDPR